MLRLCRLGSELTPQKQLKEDAEVTMQQLMTMVQYTAVSIFEDGKLLIFLLLRNCFFSSNKKFLLIKFMFQDYDNFLFVFFVALTVQFVDCLDCFL